MGANGISGAFTSGYKVNLQNRGPKSSGITFELKAIFDEMVQKGIITDKDNDGLTKEEAQNLYEVLNRMHKDTNRATTYTTMRVGQEFTYNATEMKALAEAAGYEISPDALPQAEQEAVLENIEVEPPKVEVPIPELPKPEEIEIPAPVVTDLTEIFDDSKILNRDIINVGEAGSEEQVLRVKHEDGTVTYHEVVTDKSTGGQSLGHRLVSNDRGWAKNEFYAVGDTIPNGAEVDPKMVDGKKDTPTYTIVGEDGKTQRYVMVEDPATGVYQQGDRLIDVAGSKNFKTESAVNEQLVKMFNNKNVTLESLAEQGISVQYVNTNGIEHIVFKKDGKVINGNELKNIAAQVPNPQFDVEAAKGQLEQLQQGGTIVLNGVKYTAVTDFTNDHGGEIELQDESGNKFTTRYIAAEDGSPAMIDLQGETADEPNLRMQIGTNGTITYHSKALEGDRGFEATHTTIECNDGRSIKIENGTDASTITITYPNGKIDTLTKTEAFNMWELITPQESSSTGEVKGGEAPVAAQPNVKPGAKPDNKNKFNVNSELEGLTAKPFDQCLIGRKIVSLNSYRDANGRVVAQDHIANIQGVTTVVYFDESKKPKKATLNVDDIRNAQSSFTFGYLLKDGMTRSTCMSVKTPISSQLLNEKGEVVAEFKDGKLIDAKGREISYEKLGRLVGKSTGYSIVANFN